MIVSYLNLKAAEDLKKEREEKADKDLIKVQKKRDKLKESKEKKEQKSWSRKFFGSSFNNDRGTSQENNREDASKLNKVDLLKKKYWEFKRKGILKEFIEQYALNEDFMNEMEQEYKKKALKAEDDVDFNFKNLSFSFSDTVVNSLEEKDKKELKENYFCFREKIIGVKRIKYVPVYVKKPYKKEMFHSFRLLRDRANNPFTTKKLIGWDMLKCRTEKMFKEKELISFQEFKDRNLKDIDPKFDVEGLDVYDFTDVEDSFIVHMINIKEHVKDILKTGRSVLLENSSRFSASLFTAGSSVVIGERAFGLILGVPSDALSDVLHHDQKSPLDIIGGLNKINLGCNGYLKKEEEYRKRQEKAQEEREKKEGFYYFHPPRMLLRKDNLIRKDLVPLFTVEELIEFTEICDMNEVGVKGNQINGEKSKVVLKGVALVKSELKNMSNEVREVLEFAKRHRKKPIVIIDTKMQELSSKLKKMKLKFHG